MVMVKYGNGMAVGPPTWSQTRLQIEATTTRRSNLTSANTNTSSNSSNSNTSNNSTNSTTITTTTTTTNNNDHNKFRAAQVRAYDNRAQC